MEVNLVLFFFSFSNTGVQFNIEELIWRTYTAAKAIPTARQVKLIDKHKFVKTALDENSKTFDIYAVGVKDQVKMTIHPFQIAQIAKYNTAHIAAL